MARQALFQDRTSRAHGALVEQAMRLSPRDPGMPGWLYTLGMSQLQMGDNDEAIKTFQRSLLLRSAQSHILGRPNGCAICCRTRR